jgi:creatinine amidohydrolase
MRPYILAETTWKTIKDMDLELAVLPWGATEAHNYHLPYAADTIMVEQVAADAAKEAWERGAKLTVLPAIPFGVNTGQLDIKLNINMNPGTQLAVLTDVADSLNRNGILKFMILNGHGGNEFKPIVRELGFRFPKMFICICNWYQTFDNSKYFENGGDHANEMETSIMMHVAPEFVLPLDNAGKGEAKKFKIKAFSEKWAWTERKWTKITNDTGVGDPSKSSAEKGKQCYTEIIEKISKLMTDLSNADINDMYE